MKVKLDKADKEFSRYIRLRDGVCQRCGRAGEPNKDGEAIIGLQCSHYFGRGKESTRFDPENCISLCFGCHQYWGSTDREAYREFMVGWLGEDGFKKLQLRANTYKKKDRKMSLLEAQGLLKTLG